MYHIFCTHSSVEGHLVSYQLLATINKVVMNLEEHVSLFYVGSSFGYVPKSGIYIGPQEILCSTNRQNSRLFVPAYNLTNNGGVFLFLCILPASAVTWDFDTVILTGMRWILMVVWICISLKTKDFEHFFLMILDHLSFLSR